MVEKAITLKADVLKALAHPTRLKILEILKDGEKCVCEIMPILNLEQANVSQHLAILRERGIVECRKEGLSIFYRVKDPKVFKIMQLSEEILEKRLTDVAKLLKAEA